MNNPATMNQAECSRFLAAEHEGLRMPCIKILFESKGHSTRWASDTVCDHCHGLGYVPKVDLQSLMVAMDGAGWEVQRIWSPRRISKVWGWLWRRYEPADRIQSRAPSIGGTPLLAASRAGVAAGQEEHDASR